MERGGADGEALHLHCHTAIMRDSSIWTTQYSEQRFKLVKRFLEKIGDAF